jgi:hypothetical protein
MMYSIRHFRLTLLVILALWGATGSVVATPPPGPPWPVNYPRVAPRSASDAPDKDFAIAEVKANAAPIGAVVTMSASIAKPKMGNSYDLYYQIRIHTKKGETGPLLSKYGTAGEANLSAASRTCLQRREFRKLGFTAWIPVELLFPLRK